MIRRDFLNNSLLAAGAALLRMPAPGMAAAAPTGRRFTGYAGVGDYAASNGDPWSVIEAGHKISQGKYTPLPAGIADTGESFDLIVVGAGLSGLSAAYYTQKAGGGRKRILLLENHPIFGGHCKQNEFMVNGQRLFGPQASNDFGIPRKGSRNQMDDLFSELNLPREYAWSAWDPSLKPLRFARDNYSHMDGINDTQVDVAYYFPKTPSHAKPAWLHNIFANDLEGVPFPPEVRRDLVKWRNTTGGGAAVGRHLDTITYRDYLEKELGLNPAVTKLVEPVIGLICGASPDAVCARAGHDLVIPKASAPGISFPGGNTMFARHLVRALIPDSIPGDLSFTDVLNNAVNFGALDRDGSPTRIRLNTTAIRLAHGGDGVEVTYEQGGKLYRTHGRSAVMASAGWIARHLLGDMPPALSAAYRDFHYAPALSVNVALTNWRFLYKLEAPAVRYFGDGFGWSCNIRRGMEAGAFAPPLHPDKPTVLTFYMGLYAAGHPAAEQGDIGRKKLLATSYADYERQIREQMTLLFHDAGFRWEKDVAGVVLNRWGHARILQPPGFYYGIDGKPSPRTIVEKGFGRIAIAHSELNGHQSATAALSQGKRAAESLG